MQKMLQRANTDLDQALAEAQVQFAERRPKSRSAATEAEKYMPGGNTRTILYHPPFPLRAVSGEGAMTTDADGYAYVDLNGEYTAGVYGHSHPVIKEAVGRALDGGFNLAAHNQLEIRLARLLCERFPAVDRLRFTNSGTEANLMAILTARIFTRRDKVMVFRHAYHGGVLHFGGGGFPTNVPFSFVVATYNDTTATRLLIREHGKELACILVEPMIGSGGCIPAELPFLHMLREETRSSGALLIFDEVMTSRFKNGGAQGLLGISPDLTSLGKYICGGMTAGAFGGRADIMAIYDPRRPGYMPHAGTFNNNVVSMAAGAAGLAQVFTKEEATRLHDRGDRLREELDALFQSQSAKFTATGLGSILMIHPARPLPATLDGIYGADPRAKHLLYFDLLEHGFYIGARCRLALSLAVEERMLAGFLDAVHSVLGSRRSLFCA
jgi:glutamate-1-semialdehyde 2,1-aminomutase